MVIYVRYILWSIELGETLELPMMAICKHPQIKNSTAFEKLLTSGKELPETELEELMKSALYSNVNDTLINVAIATEYSAALGRLTSYEMLNQVASVVTSDIAYTGACTVVSLEKMKQYLISKGDIPASVNDFQFQAIFLLKVSDCNMFVNHLQLTFHLGKPKSTRNICHHFSS